MEMTRSLPGPSAHRAGATCRALALAAAMTCALSGCADDPVYVQPAAPLEAFAGEGGEAAPATAQLTLPIRLERDEEAQARADRAAELGVQVPYVRRDDLDLSLEWTIKNLDPDPGVARIQVNGASELFTYVPDAFLVDPDDEDEEPPPPLLGNVPLDVPGDGTRSGVFQEDLVAEASLDLELITRGAVSPFTALAAIQEQTTEIEAGGAVIPRDAFASLVRFDVVFLADRHMVLEFVVRVRDHRDPPLLHGELTDAPPDELTTFAPADFAPPGAPLGWRLAPAP